jgi:hypothetical protein
LSYRTPNTEEAELTELRTKLFNAEKTIASFEKKQERRENMKNWWRVNEPDWFRVVMTTLVVSQLLLVIWAYFEGNAVEVETQARATSYAAERFHSPRVAAQCHRSKELGYLCAIRSGTQSALVRCTEEQCWANLP